jgi:hypothetical protein
MTRDSDTRRMAETVQLGSVRSTGSTGRLRHRPAPIDHRRFDCMAEYAGECVCGRAIPTGRAASLRPQPPAAFSQSGIPIARKGG